MQPSYGGMQPHIYQWQSSMDNGVTWTDIVGANTNNLTTSSVSQVSKCRRKVTDAINTIAYSDTISNTGN